MRRVVVTGVGIVSSIGDGADAVDPELAQRIEGWTDGRYQALRSPAAIPLMEM